MRILKLTLIVVLLGAGKLQAQFAGGVIAGVNFCQVDGDLDAGYGKVGLNFGGFVYYRLNDRLSLNTELAYSAKGARDVNEFGFIYHLRLRYIDWALLGSFNLWSNGEQGFEVQAGVTPAVLLGASNGQSGLVSPLEGVFNRFDLCGSAGFNVHLMHNLVINSRFNYSIPDILIANDPTTSFKWSNNYISLTFRYEFN